MTTDAERLEGASPQFRNFDWEKAKNFYYVAKMGSFANAGRFLNISQSSLSRQIIYLEQHLGCPLFSRHSGGIKLTRKGEELFTIISTTFSELKGFTQNTHVETPNGKKRKIRIATTHADAAYIINDLILDYNEKHPEVSFEILTNDQLLDVVMNDVDIAIRPYDPINNEIQQEPLFNLEKRLYASIEYLEKHGEPETLEDLKKHRLIAFGHPNLHPYADINWILRLGLPEGKLHEPIYISNSIECLVGAAKKGLGIISGYEKMSIIRNSGLKNILPSVTREEGSGYFIYPNYLKQDKDVLEIKEFLQANILA